MAAEVQAFLATTSDIKAAQYASLFAPLGIAVRTLDLALDLPEPQVEGTGSVAENELVLQPLRSLARFVQKGQQYPVLVEDTMLFIDFFNRSTANPVLPGPDTKRWWLALGDTGVCQVMANAHNRKASFVCLLGLLTARGRYQTFRTELHGAIAEKPRDSREAHEGFPQSNPYAFHTIFVPDGADRTLAEMGPSEFGVYDYRRSCARRAAGAIWEVAEQRAAQLWLEI